MTWKWRLDQILISKVQLVIDAKLILTLCCMETLAEKTRTFDFGRLS